MPTETDPTREQAQRYDEEFSLAIGLRDWLMPNPRHEQLKLHIAGLLRGRRKLRIIDIGCGAGVMTAYMRRYGDVTGVDFSSAAVAAARKFAPGVTFIAGSLESLPAGERFDVITLFDVLEHIPQGERPDFLAGLRERLVDDGTVFVSTPFPAFTHYRHVNDDDTLQIVDEEIELPRVTEEAARVGLQLVNFQAYDVFWGQPRVPGDGLHDRAGSWRSGGAAVKTFRPPAAARRVADRSAGQASGSCHSSARPRQPPRGLVVVHRRGSTCAELMQPMAACLGMLLDVSGPLT